MVEQIKLLALQVGASSEETSSQAGSPNQIEATS